jgi:hypothetical protein
MRRNEAIDWFLKKHESLSINDLRVELQKYHSRNEEAEAIEILIAKKQDEDSDKKHKIEIRKSSQANTVAMISLIVSLIGVILSWLIWLEIKPKDVRKEVLQMQPPSDQKEKN